MSARLCLRPLPLAPLALQAVRTLLARDGAGLACCGALLPQAVDARACRMQLLNEGFSLPSRRLQPRRRLQLRRRQPAHFHFRRLAPAGLGGVLLL